MDFDGLLVWKAVNSGGEPVCIGNGETDGGLNINLYRDEDGNIQGVEVWEEDQLLSVSGSIPIEAFNEILNENDIDVWVEAEDVVAAYNEKFLGDAV